ncbi:MAG TPA: ABC transporter substrate-binding protein [Chloroflexota bacterium]|nr:ABC transporter substrate-binding protein [Chloroflexota bacterium]
MKDRGRRRILHGSLALTGLGLLTGCQLPGLPWQAARVPRIGLLAPGPREARAHLNAGLLHGLRELGYAEGQNIAIEYRFSESNAHLPALAAELVGLAVDVIVATGGTPAPLAAKQATATIPIVFIAVTDPVGTGLVASLARPGGNSTGLTNVASVLAAKRVELLKTIIPGFSRLALILNTTNPATLAQANEIAAAAQDLGIQVQTLPIRSADDFEGAFRAAARAHADAIHPASDSVITNGRDRLAELGVSYRLPTVFDFRENTAAGGLLSYGPSLVDMYRRAATYVDKILKGSKPADLPVERPTTFDFVINLKTAQAIGLTIPPSVLQQATEIIQ